MREVPVRGKKSKVCELCGLSKTNVSETLLPPTFAERSICNQCYNVAWNEYDDSVYDEDDNK